LPTWTLKVSLSQIIVFCLAYISFGRYLIASHTTDYQNPMLFFNTLAVFVLVVAKFPNMHKVRIFGINADHWNAKEFMLGLLRSLGLIFSRSNVMVMSLYRYWNWKGYYYIFFLLFFLKKLWSEYIYTSLGYMLEEKCINTFLLRTSRYISSYFLLFPLYG
jgi:hypothetical protein